MFSEGFSLLIIQLIRVNDSSFLRDLFEYGMKGLGECEGQFDVNDLRSSFLGLV